VANASEEWTRIGIVTPARGLSGQLGCVSTEGGWFNADESDAMASNEGLSRVDELGCPDALDVPVP
jgi:hypothetical protein